MIEVNSTESSRRITDPGGERNVLRTSELVVLGSGTAAWAAAHEACRRRRSVIVVGTRPWDESTLPAPPLPGVPGRETLRSPYFRFVEGMGRFERGDSNEVRLMVAQTSGARLQLAADHVVVATGAVPVSPQLPGIEGTDHVTTAELHGTTLPDAIIVIGESLATVERAQTMARLGVRTTMVQQSYRVAPAEDPVISAGIAETLRQDGVELVIGATIIRNRRTATGIELHVIQQGRPRVLTGDRLYVEPLQRPGTDRLRLAAVDVGVGSDGGIVVDRHQRTTNRLIWAAGAVTGAHQHFYQALSEGQLAASNALGRETASLDRRLVPRLALTTPVFAAVGLTSAEAALTHQPVEHRQARRPDTPGVVEVLSDPRTRRVVGVQMLCDQAVDSIVAATFAVASGMTLDQLADGVASPFEVSEGLASAARAAPHAAGSVDAAATTTPARAVGDAREQVMEFILQYFSDPELDSGAIARRCNISRRTLYRLFGSEGVAAVLRRVRLERAMVLLTNTDYSISAVSAVCGFASESGFHRAFRTAVGETPAEYRRRHGTYGQ